MAGASRSAGGREPILSGQPVWLFAYGSLIWRPDFPFLDQTLAAACGWSRRFWQGSHDHRGTPDSPGRVVTLVRDVSASCAGVAYLLDTETLTATFEALDHREKNGYARESIMLDAGSRGIIDAVVYRAPPGNPAWLGDAPIPSLAAQIAASSGPSGHNADYLFGLAQALRSRGIDDPHVFMLESEVRGLLAGA